MPPPHSRVEHKAFRPTFEQRVEARRLVHALPGSNACLDRERAFDPALDDAASREPWELP
eukprot:3524872-Lingulodinium_polyedra.AAC.1